MKILISDSRGQIISVEINENESVKEFKEKLKQKMKITSEIVLHYDGQILEENETMAYYEVEEGCKIIYMGKFKGGILH